MVDNRGGGLRLVMTIDQIFRFASENGLKPRDWKWKPLQPYNGFTHEQRVHKWQAMHLARELGLIAPAANSPCDICGTTFPESSIGYHSEDYSSMTGHYPLCKSCHTLIHTRKRNQKAWRDLLEKYGKASQWWETLSIMS